MHEWSCHEIAKRVRGGEVSAEEVVAHHLDRIEARPELNAFITVDRERALEDARSLAREGRLGRRDPGECYNCALLRRRSWPEPGGCGLLAFILLSQVQPCHF